VRAHSPTPRQARSPLRLAQRRYWTTAHSAWPSRPFRNCSNSWICCLRTETVERPTLTGTAPCVVSRESGAILAQNSYRAWTRPGLHTWGGRSSRRARDRAVGAAVNVSQEGRRPASPGMSRLFCGIRKSYTVPADAVSEHGPPYGGEMIRPLHVMIVHPVAVLASPAGWEGTSFPLGYPLDAMTELARHESPPVR
jgi:hypothetical protein